jgi:hypothetical protein
MRPHLHPPLNVLAEIAARGSRLALQSVATSSATCGVSYERQEANAVVDLDPLRQGGGTGADMDASQEKSARLS